MNALNIPARDVVATDEALRTDVSALLDGELDAAAVERTIDGLLASEALLGFWADAHRAGDWMRSDEVVGVGDDERFLQTFRARLADEPTVLAPAAGRARGGRFWVTTGLPGASIAAALLAVVWVAAPFGRDGGGERTVAAVPVQATTPVVAGVAANTVDADRLSDYLAAHRDVTPFGYRGASARPAAYVATAGRAGPPSR